MDVELLPSFTPEELAQCYIEQRQITLNVGKVQVHWPRERFYRTLQPEHRARLIFEATDREDWDEVKRLQTTK